MKIAIITSGVLPIPAVQGGAVENLIDFYLEYNDRMKLHDITVYSIFDERVIKHKAAKSKQNKYVWIKNNTFFYRLRKYVYKYFHKESLNSHHLEYFLHVVLKKMRGIKYDYVVFENRPGFILSASGKLDAKIILHLHTDFFNEPTPYNKEILAKCDKVLTVSDYIKKQVLKIDDTDKVSVVYNGIDLGKFQGNQFSESYRHLIDGFSSSDFVIVYSGRIIPEKGVKEIIESMLRLKDYPDIKLLIIGGSFFGNEANDSDYIRSLKKLAEPIMDKIVFTGFIPYSEMPVYLRIGDIGLFPSMWNEAAGMTIVECMAVGRAIITTNAGGIPEYANDECAFFVNRESAVDEITEKILLLYNDKSRRDKMASASLQRSMIFSKERYCMNFFRAFD